MAKKTTPMMEQYLKLKKENPDAILFYRLGDFYEMFGTDADTASRELDLTLTTRDRNKPLEERVPMCGVPYHSAEAYIARLIAKGYKVAVCEQTDEPSISRALVDRHVTRVVTPGTVMDGASLKDDRANYCVAVYITMEAAGLAVCDISTAYTGVTAFSGGDHLQKLKNELARINPAEALINAAAWDVGGVRELLEEKLHCSCRWTLDDEFTEARGGVCCRTRFIGQYDTLRDQEDGEAMCGALCALMLYLHETQRRELIHLQKLEHYRRDEYMELDITARRNLELTETMRGKEKRGSLLWVLDKTKTPMGARLLRDWLERPLVNIRRIHRRQAAVEALVNHASLREDLIVGLSGMSDVERVMSRVAYGTADARDLLALCRTAEHLPAIKSYLACFADPLLSELYEDLDELMDVSTGISQVLRDELPLSVREGELIRDGFDEEVDRLRHIMHGGKSLLAELESRERERTGIRTLKVGFNKVFGYYIEVSNSFVGMVPEDYIRKQTLVNGERYINQELKDLEHDILTAESRDQEREYELFAQLRCQVALCRPRILKTAACLAALDALCSLATVAVKNNYCRPTVDEGGLIEITEGRHPVVEQMDSAGLFVPNDTVLGEGAGRVAIITGPNMAGKSTYMRQVALITLMAQMGSFVPAKAAHIGVADRIFTRIGASDDLAAGQSTFMVEMWEVSEILRSATARSLLILDEIGRGTSTYDGMSIARAVLEHCADKDKCGARTLFATHYHQLTALERTVAGTKNYNIAVRTRGEDIIFLRKIVPGGTDRSYGIEVARLAGLPESVLQNARNILQELERGESAPPQVTAPAEDDGDEERNTARQEVLAALENAALDTLSPLEAMNLLYELKKKLQS